MEKYIGISTLIILFYLLIMAMSLDIGLVAALIVVFGSIFIVFVFLLAIFLIFD